MRFTLHLLRQRLLGIFGRLADIALFLGIVLIGGLGTSWYMVEAGSPLTTQAHGPWRSWTAAARTDADPYTRAHFARNGALPLSGEVSRSYLAQIDGDGQRMHSSCEYVIEGRDMQAAWWSISVFDDRGRLISNPAQRYTFTSETLALSPDGSFMVTLARDARPGNWLPTGGAGRIAVMLTLLDSKAALLAALQKPDAQVLPSIRKVQCR